MKIVIIAPEQIPVPPILGGSVEITILAIAKELSKWHSVSIISRAHSRYPKYSVIDGVNIYRVPTGSPAKYLTHVKKILKKRQFDVLQIDNRPEFVGQIKSMFPKATVSLYLHSLTFVNFPHTSRAETLAGLRKADLIITNSSSLERRLSARFPSMSRKIRVAWLGVDTSRFSPIQKTSHPRAFTLLFAGRLIPRKGVPVLLQAVKLVNKQVNQPVKVMIAGGSPTSKYARQLQSLSRKFGVHAEFLGTIPHCHIHRVFRKADLFICPSQKHESFGLVNVEAMSSGLPVVASKNGGIKEVIQHGRSGLLIKQYKNPQAFADAICSLIMNKPLYLKMKQEARQIALEKFSWCATADRLNHIYESEKDLQQDKRQNEYHCTAAHCHERQDLQECNETGQGAQPERMKEEPAIPQSFDIVHDWSSFDDDTQSITSTGVFQNFADLCTENDDESDGSNDSAEATFDFFSDIGYQRLVDALIYG
ncbi:MULTISPECIES: glycosyltransferase family 4 protein [Brevibacillus]|uniref:glycosyltransferase family 4 protein n=1 Tax=Brevibacillus TaxID=55080 RepID=UPI001C8CF660|nr:MULTISPECIES: glycosyltransferase family 4 protein [Brevibacillus]MBY0083600.1 glycosyltransferase family 4 protein [Brevibacillus brevis]MCE0451972.1 glycosyltransferase family 4 protein [Brevibacillus sp. AF8]